MRTHPVIRGVAVTTVALLCGLSPGDLTNASIGEPDDHTKHLCPEYTRGSDGNGRVLAGEFQTLTCDLRPPQHLDLVMYPRRIDGESPRERCDDMGGRLIRHSKSRKLRCLDVDY